MRSHIGNLVQAALSDLATTEGWSSLGDLDPSIERTRDVQHGDFTTNVAMRAAKTLGLQPRELASRIANALPPSELVAAVEVAGPGFINIRLTSAALRRGLVEAIEHGDAYGTSNLASGRRVLIEYLSANPTGPLHVGHGRLAAFGASLASLLRATGHDVDEEYYINDAGRQMDILAVSVCLRYVELDGHVIRFPDNCYQGAYCRDIAAQLKATHGARLSIDAASLDRALADDDQDKEARLDRLIAALKEALGPEGFSVFLHAAIDSILADIRDDLAEFGVVPDRWYSELDLVASGAIDAALAQLRQENLLYEADGATWFRSTDFGDDKDRVVIRENGAKTYFASDIAYHLEKCRRGYDLLLNVLGSDHHGYVARIRAGLQGMGESADKLEVRLVQFVVLYRGAKKVQMTTRGGTYVTLRELRGEVGNDAARFFYVSRSNDQHLDFDLELAKSQSNENPVHYVQYAHARIESVLQKLRSLDLALPQPMMDSLQLLGEDSELGLIREVGRYPEVIEHAALNRAPQLVVQYLRDLAAQFHSNYDSHKVLVEDVALRDARVLLALGTRQVLRNGLRMLGVTAPDRM